MGGSTQANPVYGLYTSVIENVMERIRELYEAPEEEVLKELKELWVDNLRQSKAVDFPPPPTAPTPLPLVPQSWWPMSPHPQLIFNHHQGRFMQVLRGPNGGVYMQPLLLHRPMPHPGGLPFPPLPHFPLQGGARPPPRHPGVMVQPHPYGFTGAMTPPPRFCPMVCSSPWTRQVQQQQACGPIPAPWNHPGGVAAAAATPLEVSGGTTQSSTPWFQTQQAPTSQIQASSPTPAVWGQPEGVEPAATPLQVSGGTATVPCSATPWYQGSQQAIPTSQVPADSGAVAAAATGWAQQQQRWARNGPETLPEPEAAQAQLQRRSASSASNLVQVDGTGDTSSLSSSSEDEDEDEDEDVSKEEKEEEDVNRVHAEDEELSVDDDESDGGEKEDEFEADNVVVCQYEKQVRHVKSKWRFHLADGIMNIEGKDYVFSKANGEAIW